MSDTYVYDEIPKYDHQRNQWYWEGRRTDGKKVRKYHPADNQTTQYDANQYVGGYQSTPYDATAGLEGGMQALNLQQQPADTYNTGASNYATWPTDAQAQGPSTYTGESSRHRRRDEGVPSGHHATPRTVPTPSGYQTHSGSTYEQFQQPPLTSVQASTNAGYGAGGDSVFQHYGQEKGKSVAGPRSGQDTLVPQPDSNISYGQYDSLQGTSQFGQSPSNIIDDRHPQDRSRKSKHKGKGKAIAEANAYHFRDEQRAVDYGGTQHGGYSHSGGPNPRRPSGTPSDTAGFLQGQGAPYTAGSGSRPTIIPESLNNLGGNGDDGEDDAELQASIEASRAAYGYGAAGGMSTGGGPAYQVTSDNAPPPVAYPGSSRPRDGHISGTEGRFERLDPRFKVERSSRFEPGEVFKVMWTEPRGERHPVGGGSVITELVPLQDHMENVWTGFRRFIVIGNDEGHCTCVPILTYGNQGCRKSGVKPHKHGIVYEQGGEPVTLRREPELGFEPICMQITAANEHISEDSRVNYSKLVTIEHNVKVFFVGRISYEDWPTVQGAVDKCWGDKKRDKSHHASRRDRR